MSAQSVPISPEKKEYLEQLHDTRGLKSVPRDIYYNFKNKKFWKVSDTAYLRKKYAPLSKRKRRDFTVLQESPVCNDNIDTSNSIFLLDFKFEFSEFRDRKRRKMVNEEEKTTDDILDNALVKEKKLSKIDDPTQKIMKSRRLVVCMTWDGINPQLGLIPHLVMLS